MAATARRIQRILGHIAATSGGPRASYCARRVHTTPSSAAHAAVYATNDDGTPAVRVETNGPIATVILSRPHAKNAIDRPTAQGLADAFRKFDADDTLSVAVLWGEGGTFCAGADLKAVAHAADKINRLESDGDGPLGPTRMQLSKPVIAAVSGYAVAGGLELALWCDMRVAEEDAVFGVFCRRFGVPLIDGGTIRLPRLIGLSRAMDLILTGRACSATEAHAMGLANRLVPKGKSRDEAEAIARKIAEFPQLCMRGDRKSALENAFGPPTLTEALRAEFEIGKSALTWETVAGAKRFAEGSGRHGEGTR